MKFLLSCWVLILLTAWGGFSPVGADTPACEWNHSCPTLDDAYVCGDTGQCSRCPDNEYCLGGQPKGSDLLNGQTDKEKARVCQKFQEKAGVMLPDRLIMFCKTEMTGEECGKCLKIEKEPEE